nr:GNAT family N-acetyltransferase [uncultured Acetatifactor sp.]
MCPYSKQEYKEGDRDGNNQKQGIGTRLLKAVMEKYESVYQMELLTDDTEKTVSFYRSAGFLSVEELGCKAFMRA